MSKKSDISISASEYNADYKFEVNGGSYIARPRSSTVLFVGKKLEAMLGALGEVEYCLVFVEQGMQYDKELCKRHCMVEVDNPARAYGEAARILYEKRVEADKSRAYRMTEGGYTCGENVMLGNNVVIEPGALIGHDVEIGDGTVVLSGAIIKNTTMGENCVINEHAVIGSSGFTMYEDEWGNNQRICSLGKVVMGKEVEIGAGTVVCRGMGGDTLLGDYVKMDNLIHIGHDVQCGRNVSIIAGTILGGFCILEDNAYLGLNSTLRNRITIGAGALVGMGSVVTKDVPPNAVVMGNPARKREESNR